MKHLKIVALIVSLALSVGCSVNPTTGEKGLNKSTIGAGVGLVAGGLIGAALGDHRAALAGAAIGASIGAGTGYWLDEKAKRLAASLQDTNIGVSRQTDAVSGREVLVLHAPSDVTFASGSAELQSTSYRGLMRAASSLVDVPGLQLEVIGHTDNRGSFELNQKLSQARAENVAAFLVSAGIPASAVTARGVGFASPVTSNDHDQGRAMNRRVEVRVSSTAATGGAVAAVTNTY
jgi:outer membrane protein OmpA-like peptidoglycan-associated protein